MHRFSALGIAMVMVGCGGSVACFDAFTCPPPVESGTDSREPEAGIDVVAEAAAEATSTADADASAESLDDADVTEVEADAGSAYPSDGLEMLLEANAGISRTDGGTLVWTDESAAHNDATAADSAVTVTADTPPAVLIPAGASLSLGSRAYDFSRGLTFFSVFRESAPDAGPVEADLLHLSAGAGQDVELYVKDREAGLVVYAPANGRARANIPDTGWHLLEVVVDGAGLATVYLDGTSPTSKTIPLPASVTYSTNMITGGDGVEIRVMGLYDHGTTEDERKQIEAAVRARWGLQ